MSVVTANASVPCSPPSGDVYPVSFAQQQLWFLDQINPGSPAYNIARTFELDGELDRGALERSVLEIIRRHEILRTTYRLVSDQPVQIIHDEAGFELPLLDFSALPAQQQELELAHVSQAEARHALDLQNGPLLRARLFRLRPQKHVLLVGTHHIASDGWSLRLFTQELATLYQAFSQGNPPPLQELSVQYRDFSVWQREYLRGEGLQRLLSFWKRQLEGAPPFLELPFNAPSAESQTFRGSLYTRALPRGLADELKQLSRATGVTLFMVVAAGFQAILARYSGQEDIVIGVPLAYRRRPEFENLIGFFANTLALRTDVSGNPTFSELLRRVRHTALAANTHQDLPFQLLVEALRPERHLSRNPLFQVMLALQPSSLLPLRLPNLTLTPSAHPIDTGTAKFDLSLSIGEHAGELSCTVEYNADRFQECTVSRLMDHFQRLLEQAVDDPERRLSQFRLLSESERQQLLANYNKTQQPIATATVHVLIEQQAKRTPQGTAVVCGNERITYSELNLRANQLAQHLIQLGVVPEMLVGIALKRGIDMVVALLGVLKAGGAYLPIDLSFPCDRIADILEDSQVRLVITERPLSPNIAAASSELIYIDDVIAAPLSIENLKNDVAPESLAYVLYTSGSTGKPKGVQVTHRSLVNLLRSMRDEPGITANDALLAVTTLSFDIAGLEIFLPLIVGATVATATEEEVVDPAKLLQCIRRYDITMMQATPTTWRMLLASGWTGNSTLKILCGGEALPGELARQLLPRCHSLWNLYGPTETTIWSSLHRVSAHDKAPVVPIGRPIANTTFYLLDAHLQPVPTGVTGEVYIGGVGVSRGYLGRPELTAQKFVPDPFGSTSNGKLYRTGDLARYDPEGGLHFLGRCDTQVKLRGFRIELAEIETVLLSQSSIHNAVVILRQDSRDEPQLVAYLIPAAGAEIDVASARRELKRHVPEYMVPSAFVVLESLPLTPNGKIDRKLLPPPGQLTSAKSSPAVPRDEIEEMLTAIWEKLLQVRPISVQDNFFELGGHSMLALKLMNEIRTVIGRQLSLAVLFQSATIEHLAGIIREAPEGLAYPLVMRIHGSQTVPSREASPPFFCVAAPGVNAVGYIALARHMRPDQPLYKLQAPRPGQPAALGPRPYTAMEWESLAGEYIQAMRSVQPQGPYFLGGMCGGGRIAFDMARQLRTEGQEVRLLAIFDTWAFENTQIRWLWKLDYYRQRWRALRNESTAEKISSFTKFVSRRAHKLLRVISPTRGRAHAERSPWMAAYWPGQDFVPATYPGRITLFRLSSQPFYRIRDQELGWGSRALLGVDTHIIASHSRFRHMDLFREPLVAELAQILSDRLRTARGDVAAPAMNVVRAEAKSH